jgi:hypothetical protein
MLLVIALSADPSRGDMHVLNTNHRLPQTLMNGSPRHDTGESLPLDARSASPGNTSLGRTDPMPEGMKQLHDGKGVSTFVFVGKEMSLGRHVYETHLHSPCRSLRCHSEQHRASVFHFARGHSTADTVAYVVWGTRYTKPGKPTTR